MANRYTFVQRIGNTRFSVNLHFSENENAETYEEKLLNVIRNDAEALQDNKDSEDKKTEPAA